ncbi:MAG: phosphoenolpyruvate carboxylase [Niabella sp.]|nr:phosphoenolpyruvate carboxylase [Niabella sp.]
MDVVSSQSVEHFKNDVGTRFQLYNSLFTSLPFNRIEKTGILLSLLSNMCEEGYEKGLSPVEIIEDFFNRHTSFPDQKTQVDLLFRLIQYVERQVVLFDALEDASYKDINDLSGPGTLKQLLSAVTQNNKEKEFDEVLKNFCVRLVLTAHPTQFYPGSVLGIIRDLSKALEQNDASEINMLLRQLGKTPFLKKQKPTPYDEAVSLIWYLENVFYQAAGQIVDALKNQFPEVATDQHTLIKMGFWPGGDRDGNPFVTSATTLQVADALRAAVLRCYYHDVRRLRRRLTFQGVEDKMIGLEKKLYDEVFVPGNESNIRPKEIVAVLKEVKEIVDTYHNGLFVSKIEDLINKIEVFGLHFASLDIRQDSSIHEKVFSQIAASGKVLPEHYDSLSENEKVRLLLDLKQADVAPLLKDEVVKDTVDVINAMRSIQRSNGEEGCNRYIISHSTSVLNIIEVIGLFRLNGVYDAEMTADIVPLFETIEDLQNAGLVMKQLYSLPEYKEHLNRRGKTQTIMLGFSDGTKDGGYLMANWSIYRAKEELTRITRQYGFDVIFFDGRGGPPSRGGGKTHKFYASMGSHISNKEIQLTIQGQTVSANFGIIDSAQFNLEQLINAGVSNSLFTDRYPPLSGKKEELLQELSSYGFDAYKELKEHPQLANYLYEMSPLRFYNETNIGSRPAKRGGSQTSFTLSDLRAIPFSGAWSQLKQNVPGFFGVGTALKQMEYVGRFDELKQLYNDSLYFKTLLDNCEMAMSKSYFPITAYIANDEQFGDIWKMIYDEFVLTKQYIYKLTGHDTLMASYPVDKLSIRMRERIVMPLVTIQQYALVKLREGNSELEDSLREAYEKLVMRCSFGIINAGRNSA